MRLINFACVFVLIAGGAVASAEGARAVSISHGTPSPAVTSPSVSPSLTPSPSVSSSPVATSPIVSPAPSVDPSSSPKPVAKPTPTPPLRVLYHGSRKTHQIALTFDDGFRPAVIKRVGEILIKNKVPATFFVIGRVAAYDKSVIRPLARMGFPFGSHTWSHDNLTRSDFSQATVAADIRRGATAIEAVTGVPTVPFIRPYGGYFNSKVIKAAQQAGMRGLVLWDIDSRDAIITDEAGITWSAEQGENGTVLLMHMNNYWSADVLQAVIDHYRKLGYTFVTLGQMFGVPGPVPSFGPIPTVKPAPMPIPMPTIKP